MISDVQAQWRRLAVRILYYHGTPAVLLVGTEISGNYGGMGVPGWRLETDSIEWGWEDGEDEPDRDPDEVFLTSDLSIAREFAGSGGHVYLMEPMGGVHREGGVIYTTTRARVVAEADRNLSEDLVGPFQIGFR